MVGGGVLRHRDGSARRLAESRDDNVDWRVDRTLQHAGNMRKREPLCRCTRHRRDDVAKVNVPRPGSGPERHHLADQHIPSVRVLAEDEANPRLQPPPDERLAVARHEVL